MKQLTRRDDIFFLNKTLHPKVYWYFFSQWQAEYHQRPLFPGKCLHDRLLP